MKTPNNNHEEEKPSTDLDPKISDLNQLWTFAMQELRALKKRLLEMEPKSSPLSPESAGDQDNDAKVCAKAAATTAAINMPIDPNVAGRRHCG
ncbi:hypothetical protein FGB62_197g03 [Gracilaria domingensis]|nr:hypothetical protein FGB62_197g03 [Gracilaria domingensis]